MRNPTTPFMPLNSVDLHLFNEGSHHRIYEKMGSHPGKYQGEQGVFFSVWAPNATSVRVVGDFNEWNPECHWLSPQESSGIWSGFIEGAHVGQRYKYAIESKQGSVVWKSDPYGFAMEFRPSTASVITEIHQYDWKDHSWMEQRPHQSILEKPISIYEVHLGSWRRIPEENNRFLTYREAAFTLVPYVRDMGYTHIEFLPLAEHPLDDSWGYQVTGYYAATSRHGSPYDLMFLIDQCHQAGIGVILDWVPGHFPKNAEGLAQFDGTALYEHEDSRIGEHHQWGTLVFNYGRHEVKNFLIANALFWFDYYHIDGIRVDAVASMLYRNYNRKPGDWIPNAYGGEESLEAVAFFKQLHTALFYYYPGVLSIAEESTSWAGVTRPVYAGGLGFNLKWNMGWMNDTLRYVATDSLFRKYHQSLMTFSLYYAFHENFVLPISHDEVVHGKKSLLAKMPGDVWQQRANFRVYLTFQMAHPGKKLLFMGSEWGQWHEWKSHTSLDWHLLETQDHQQLRHFCRALNQCYRQHPAFYTQDFEGYGFEWIDCHDHPHSVFAFLRYSKNTDDLALLCLFNFTPVPHKNYHFGVPSPGPYTQIWNSDASEFGGSHWSHHPSLLTESVTWQGRPYRIQVDLPPLGAMLFSFRTVKNHSI